MSRRLPWALGGVGCLLAAALLYQLLLTDLPAVVVNAGDRQENLLPLVNRGTIGQTFSSPRTNLSGIELLLKSPSGVRLSGAVTLHLRRAPADTTDLRSTSVSVSTFRRAAHTRFRFPPLDTTNEPQLFLVLEHPEGTPERPLLVRTELPRPDGQPRDDYAGGTALVDGTPIAGDLAFRLLERGRLPFGTQVAALVGLVGLALLAAAAVVHAPPSAARLVLAVGLPVVFYLPLLKDPTFLGVGDWDMNSTLHAAAARALTIEQTFPSWNPYLCGGTPLAAFPEAPVFSPFFGLTLLGNPVIGFKVNILLHGIIGFLGMLAWLRWGWKTSWTAAFLGAGIVSFSSFVALHIFAGHTRKVAFAFIPWVMLFFQRATDEQQRTRRQRLRLSAASAIALALMAFDGSVYLTAYTGLALAVLGTVTSVLRRSLIPAALAILVLLLAGLLAGVHLIPAAASQAAIATRLDMLQKTLPARGLVDVFLDPNQHPHSQKFDGQPLEWFEYGAYVGVVPLLFAVLGVLGAPRRALPWAVTGALFLVGSFLPAAHALFARLPVMSDLRNPQRMVAIVVVVIGPLAALGLDHVRRWLTGPEARAPSVTAALTTLVGLMIGHLLYTNSETFASTFTVPPPAPAPASFQQGWAKVYYERTVDSFVFSMANTLRNRGSLNRCSAASIFPSAELRLPEETIEEGAPTEHRDQPYAGEVFIARGDGRVRVTDHQTSRVTFDYDLAGGPALVALNENYHPGWTARLKTDGRTVRKPARPWNAIVGLELEAGRGTATFTYDAPYLGTGLAATALGFGLALALLIRRDPSTRTDKSAHPLGKPSARPAPDGSRAGVDRPSGHGSPPKAGRAREGVAASIPRWGMRAAVSRPAGDKAAPLNGEHLRTNAGS